MLTDVYNGALRINADAIDSYYSNGDNSVIFLRNGERVDVIENINNIDNALAESFFMIKRVCL